MKTTYDLSNLDHRDQLSMEEALRMIREGKSKIDQGRKLRLKGSRLITKGHALATEGERMAESLQKRVGRKSAS